MKQWIKIAKLLVLTIPFLAQADDFTYRTNSDNTITITGYTGPGGAVTIPETINSLPVLTIGNGAFQSKNNLISVIIPESATRIEAFAFNSCTNLISVSIGKNVNRIDHSSFQHCCNLTVMTVDDLNSVYSSMDGVLFNTNRTVLLRCLEGKTGNYTIPDSVTSIGDDAFQYCLNLTSVTIPDSVTNIGNDAFWTCVSLTNILIGRNVALIGSSPLQNCTKLTTITVDGLNSTYSSADGVLFNKNCTKLIQCGAGKSGSYTVPAGVTNITARAFFSCKYMTHITIPDSVVSIGSYAFYNCTGITGIYFKGNAPDIANAVDIFAEADNATIYHLSEKTGWPVVPNVWGNRPTALWNPLYLLTVNSGTGSGSYTNGTCVNITADNAPNGQVFSCWTEATSYVASVATRATVIKMPAQDISVTATYSDLYTYVTNAGNITITKYIGSESSVIIPDTIRGLPVTRIGNDAFGSCYSLTNLIIGTNVTNIGDRAFFECGSLTSVSMGNNVASIGNSAFSFCYSLTNIIIPDGVTSIGAWAFTDNISLSAITVSASNSFYSSVDGVLFDKLKTTLIQYPGGKSGNYTIPNGVTLLSWTAFYDCPNLTSVTIPGSVTRIEGEAFCWCPGMTAVYFLGNAPDTDPDCDVFYANNSTIYYVSGTAGWGETYCDRPTEQWEPYTYTTNNSDSTITIRRYLGSAKVVSVPGAINGVPVSCIGVDAFRGCTNLTSVTIPDGVTSIDGQAFDSCTSLTNVTIPRSVTSVGPSAFGFCENLTSVLIPDGVVSIGVLAFRYCTNLTTIFISGSVTNIGLLPFDNCIGMKAITVDTSNPVYSSTNGVLFDKNKTSLFYYPTDKDDENYIVPDSVTNIAIAAFAYCTNLTRIVIPDSVTSIGWDAFRSCLNLTRIVIPDSVTSIRRDTFAGCYSLTNVMIGKGVTNIGAGAFDNCFNLTGVTIPHGVTSIEGFAFSGCLSLNSVIIPDSVTIIGQLAFQGCRSLNSVTIPGSITSMGDGVFSGCYGLTIVTIPNGVNSIGSNVFSSCTSLTNVTIPDSVTSIGNSAFSSCTSLTKITIPGSVTNIGSPAVTIPAMSSQNIVALNSEMDSAGDPVSDEVGNGVFFNCTGLTEVYLLGNAPTISQDIFYGADNVTVYYLPGTTGWGETFGGRPTALWLPQIQTGETDFGVKTNGFGFGINWADGMTVVVEACTNLAEGTWFPVETNTLTGSSVQFSDPSWTNYPNRYYRVSMPQ